MLPVEAEASPDEEPPQRHPLTVHLHDAQLLQEWIRPDQPFPPGPAGNGCSACTAIANEVAHLRAAPAVDKTALQHARNRWGLHRGVHEWIELVLERLLEPEEAEALRSPVWEGERGRPVLRCPARPGGEATQVFFLLHRYRFGQEGREMAATVTKDCLKNHFRANRRSMSRPMAA